MKNNIIHKIAFWILTILFLYFLSAITGDLNNEDNEHMSPQNFIQNMLMLVSISIVYYSWWKLWVEKLDHDEKKSINNK
jgi:hypothetical protein